MKKFEEKKDEKSTLRQNGMKNNYRINMRKFSREDDRRLKRLIKSIEIEMYASNEQNRFFNGSDF